MDRAAGPHTDSHRPRVTVAQRPNLCAEGDVVTDAVFSGAEYTDRLARVRTLLIAQDVEVCVVMAPDTQFWLSGLESFISGLLPQALIFSVDPSDEPTLVMWDADVPLGRSCSVFEDIRSYRFGVDDPVAAFVAVLHEKLARPRRVGLDASSRAVTHAFGLSLASAISPASLVDCTATFGDARVVKSPAELDYLRRAGRHADVGIRAAQEFARAGVTERRLAAEVEYAMRCAGSDYPSIPTEIGSGPRAVFGHGTPTDRVLIPGDLVHVEIGGVEHRYNCVGIQTLCVGGAPPSPAGQRLYDVALSCLRAGLEAIEPGIEAHAVEAPALSVLRDSGMGDGFMMRFGYGVGVGYPPTWLDPLQITRTSTQRLVVGSTFVLHACLLDEQDPTGVLVGGTFAIGDAGLEMLAGAGAVDLLTT